MAERLSLDLELLEKVSGPARAAAAALRQVDEAAQKAQKGGLDKLGAAFAKVGMKAAAVEQKQSAKFADAFAKIGMKAESDRIKSNARIAKASAVAKDKAAKAFAAKSDEGFKDLGDSLKTGASIFAAVSGAAIIAGAYKAVGLWKEGVAASFKEGAAYEQLKLGYKLTLGKEKGAEALGDISRFAPKTGYDDDEIAQIMRPLFQAGMRGQGARSAFAAAGDLSAASGRPVEEFADLMAKIQLKGGITTKMLMGMGLDAKGFKTELGKNLGVDKETAMKKAEEGKADPQHILNALYTMIEKRQGGKLGTGTNEFADTMGAKLHLLEQLPSNFLKKVADSDAWPKMTAQVGKLLDGLDPDGPNGKRIIDGLTDGFGRLLNLAQLAFTPENIVKFTDAVVSAIDVIGKIPDLIGAVSDAAGQVKDVLAKLGIDLSISKAVEGPDSWAGQQAVKIRDAGLSKQELNADAGVSPLSDIDEARARLADQPSPFRAARAGSGSGVTMTGVTTNVNIFPAKDDVAHSTKEAGKAVADNTVKSAEKAAHEGGGG